MSKMAEAYVEHQMQKQIMDLQDCACTLSYVIDDIRRISRYIDFLVDDISYLNDPNTTLNASDFDITTDVLRIQKLFANFREKYKKDFEL